MFAQMQKNRFAAVGLIAGMVLGFATSSQAHPRSWEHSHGYSQGGGQSAHTGPRGHRHNKGNTYVARVINTTPIYDRTPRKPRTKTVCHTEQVPIYGNQTVHSGGSYGYGQDTNADGALAGAIIGGLLGRAIADDHRKGTVIGAIGGAVVGAHADNRYNSSYGSQGYTTTKRVVIGYKDKQVCNEQTVQRRAKRKLIGYDVTYKWRGQTYTSRLDYDPGDTVTISVGNQTW